MSRDSGGKAGNAGGLHDKKCAAPSFDMLNELTASFFRAEASLRDIVEFVSTSERGLRAILPFARLSKRLPESSFTDFHSKPAGTMSRLLYDQNSFMALHSPETVAYRLTSLLVSFSLTGIKCALKLSQSDGISSGLLQSGNLVEIGCCLTILDDVWFYHRKAPFFSHVLAGMLVPRLEVLVLSRHHWSHDDMIAALDLMRMLHMMIVQDIKHPPVINALSPCLGAVVQLAFRSLSCFSTGRHYERGQEFDWSKEWQSDARLCFNLACHCSSIVESAVPPPDPSNGASSAGQEILLLHCPILDILCMFFEQGVPLSFPNGLSDSRHKEMANVLKRVLQSIRCHFSPCLALGNGKEICASSADGNEAFLPSLCLSQCRRICANAGRQNPLFAHKEHFVPLLERLADSPWSIEDAIQYDFNAASQSMGSVENWEVLQAKMMREAEAAVLTATDPSQASKWAVEVLWCCNPRCTNLSGPSELQLKTFACGGGCGFRYCSVQCQEQGWRAGHKDSCARCASVRMGLES